MSEKFEISRVFEASRERVWDAWTKPEQLACWLAPKGTTSDVKHFELKPGGYLHSKLTDTEGNVSWGKNVYREIDARNRLVWEQGCSNEAGDIVPPPFPMPWPRLMLTTVLFEDDGMGTRVTLTWEPIDPSKEELESFVQMLPSMTGGWTGTFDQLNALLTAG
jgi:uncharacterized protein YndB with AHSA1/START domain